MIEDITKEKLVEYGFSETQIERLFTWKDYTCAVIGDRGYLWASNIENKIYSGIEGRDKHFAKSLNPLHHKNPKEKFETFEELYNYAVLVGSIKKPKTKYEYSSNESLHQFGFNVWLQNYRGWNYGDVKHYKELLTRKSWVDYLAFCESEKRELINKAETIKTMWQPQNNQPKPEVSIENHNQINLFNEFIREVQTIEIRLKEYYVEDGEILDWTPEQVPDYDKLRGVTKESFLDLSHYNQHKSSYDNKIKIMQQEAISALLQMNKEQIELNLKRIEQIIDRHKKFYKHYFKVNKEPNYKQLFDNEMNNLFIIQIERYNNIGEAYNMKYSDLSDWADAVMFKQTYLQGFENQVKKVLGINETKASTVQPIEPRKKVTAKHHVICYILECHATGKQPKAGNKKALEEIGNNRIGVGKGNNFYKVFNQISNSDINKVQTLISFGGENWREIVMSLSNEKDKIENYLKSKQM